MRTALSSLCIGISLFFSVFIMAAPTSAQTVDFCSTQSSATAYSRTQHVYPWAVAVRASHSTQYNRNYQYEYGFYDVPKDHYLYGELEKFYLWDIVPERCPHIVGLSDQLTRSELAYIVAKVGLYTNNIPGMVIPLTAPFGDVPVTHKDATALHTLLTYDVIDNGTAFRPNAIATRADAVAMLARVYKLETNPYISVPFRDFDNSAWYAPYVKAAYGNGYLKPMTTFAPNTPLTKEEFFALLSYMDNKEQSVYNQRNIKTVESRTTLATPKRLANPGFTTKTVSTAGSSTSTNTAQTTTLTNRVEITSRSGSRLALPKSATTVTLLEGTMTNGFVGNQQLEGVEFSVSGILPPKGFTRLEFVIDGTTFPGTLNNRLMSFRFDRPVTLLSRSNVSWMVRGQLNGSVTTGDFSLSATGEQWLFSKAITLGGNFPITGPQTTFSNLSVASLNVQHSGSNTFDLVERTQGVRVHTLRFSSNDFSTDMIIKGFWLRKRGSIQDNSVFNLRLNNHYNNQQVGSTVKRLDSSDKVYFDFSNLPAGGLVIDNGTDVVLDLIVDLGEANDKTLWFIIDEPTEVIAQIAQTALSPTVNVDQFNNTVPKLTVNEGYEYDPVDRYYNW